MQIHICEQHNYARDSRGLCCKQQRQRKLCSSWENHSVIFMWVYVIVNSVNKIIWMSITISYQMKTYNIWTLIIHTLIPLKKFGSMFQQHFSVKMSQRIMLHWQSPQLITHGNTSLEAGHMRVYEQIYVLFIAPRCRQTYTRTHNTRTPSHDAPYRPSIWSGHSSQKRHNYFVV